MKSKCFSDAPLKNTLFREFSISEDSPSQFSVKVPSATDILNHRIKKLYFATYIHNYISINDFSNIQQANHEKQSISFLLHKQLVHKDKRNFYRFRCKKEKTKKEAGLHAGKITAPEIWKIQ